MAGSAKGTMENPYSMSECDSMLDNGTWPGGYVKDDSGEVTYVMKSVTVQGYSGSGSGSDWGSGNEDGSGSDDGDDGKGVTGNEGGNPGGGGSPGGISLSVMTQSEFDNISKACAVTPAVSSMLKTLYDGKKIVTYPTGHIRPQHVIIRLRKDWKSPGKVSVTTWKVQYTMNWFIMCRIRRGSLPIHRAIPSSRLI